MQLQPGAPGQRLVMGGDQDAHAALLGLGHQQLHDPFGVQRVQRGGGLVRQHDARSMGQGPGDADPLALAHGECRRQLVQLVGDFQLLGQAPDRGIGRQAEQRPRQPDVALHVEKPQQPARL